MYRPFTGTLAHLDLTQKQVSVLWLVEDHPRIAHTDLAQRMRIDRANAMTIVDRLEARGFLKRGKSKVDARKQTLEVTAPGRAALRAAKAATREHEQRLKSRFSTKEVTQLIEFLTMIHE